MLIFVVIWGVAGHVESESEQYDFPTCIPWSTGADFDEHQGWSPSILVQVSNILLLNTNGKVQFPHSVDVGYVGGSLVGVQSARKPMYGKRSSEENLGGALKKVQKKPK